MNSIIKNNRISHSAQSLLEIEEALNTPLFFGISVGATLNDTLIMSLYTSNRIWDWRTRVKNSICYIYERYRQPLFSSQDFSKYAGRIVFTWLFDRTDLKAFVLPLLKKYDFDESVVVVPYPSMQKKLPSNTLSVTWSEFPKIDVKAWRREFDRCVPTWRYRLYKLMKKHSIPLYVADYLLCRLQTQTKRIMANSLFLDMIKPKIIVTECDRSAQSSCLVLAAKLRRIPTVTMIHGVMEPYPSYGFTPILADYVCCWGDRHKFNLIKHGTTQSKLIVTGSQAISKTLNVSSDTARLKLSLPIDKPLVMLATSTMEPAIKLEYTFVFCKAMSKMFDITAVVRIHPAENLKDYQVLINQFPHIKFLSNDVMSRDESIAAADIVISHESSFGVDALLKGKLIIILDVVGIPLKVGKELIDMAGCPRVVGEEELSTVIRSIFSDDDFKNRLHAKAKIYAQQYCDSFEQEATNNVCRVIDEAIDNVKNCQNIY